MHTELLEIEFVYTTTHIPVGKRSPVGVPTRGSVAVLLKACDPDDLALVLKVGGHGFPSAAAAADRRRWVAAHGDEIRTTGDTLVRQQGARILPGRLGQVLNAFGRTPLLPAQIGDYDPEAADLAVLRGEIGGKHLADDHDERMAAVISSADRTLFAGDRLWAETTEPMWVARHDGAEASSQGLHGYLDYGRAGSSVPPGTVAIFRMDEIEMAVECGKAAGCMGYRGYPREIVEIHRPEFLGDEVMHAAIHMDLKRLMSGTRMPPVAAVGAHSALSSWAAAPGGVWDPLPGGVLAAAAEIIPHLKTRHGYEDFYRRLERRLAADGPVFGKVERDAAWPGLRLG